ncbi:MAG: TetR/AcrR family transcriptional regulator [Anaerolineales bacterium]
MREDLPTDRRIIRTKMAIREALVALMEEKGFDVLSVKDITTLANINRGTFYLRYRDKFDLLEQTQAEIIQHIETIILTANPLNLADFNSVDKPLPVAVTLFEYLKENAALMHAILGLHGGITFQSLIRQTVEKNLKLGFLAGVKAENFLVTSDYLISYASSAHFGVIQAWLQRGCIESPKEMALILSRLSLDGPIRSTGVFLK